eukprot:11199705-Alexandrium_andersonii.AAC.1
MGSMYASEPGTQVAIDPQTPSDLARKWPTYHGGGGAAPSGSTGQKGQDPDPEGEEQGPSSLSGVAPGFITQPPAPVPEYSPGG